MNWFGYAFLANSMLIFRTDSCHFTHHVQNLTPQRRLMGKKWVEWIRVMNVIWGDVKPSNGLTDSLCDYCVVDFGGGLHRQWIS